MGSKAGGSTRIPYEQDDTLRARAEARVIDLLGDGPWDGLADTEGRLLVNALLTVQPEQDIIGALFYDEDDYPADPGTGRIDNIIDTQASCGYTVAGEDGRTDLHGEIQCLIEGDGDGADIRAIIWPLDDYPEGRIRGIKVVNGGSGYTWANVTIPPSQGTAIFFDDVPLIDPSTFVPNFPSVKLYLRDGTADNAPLDGFVSAEETVEIGQEITYEDHRYVPYQTEDLEGNYDSVLINISLPNGCYLVNTEVGDVIAPTQPIEFRITVKYSADDGAYSEEQSLGSSAGTYQDTFYIEGKTRSPYVHTIRAILPKSASARTHKWRLCLYRVTGDDGKASSPWDGTVYNPTTLLKLDSVVLQTTQPLNYPYSALVGIQIDAEAFPRIPERRYRMRMSVMPVPTNYFPPGSRRADGTYRTFAEYNRNVDTGEEVWDEADDPVYQEWDGEFYDSWTNNPAWVFHYVATNTRIGLGDNLIGGINKWELYTIGRYCDELVHTGWQNGSYAGWEPRFTCNCYVQNRVEAWQFLSDLAAAFRAMIYWAGGQLALSQDIETDPVMQFTNANVENGEFLYSSTSRSGRFTAVIVKWNNPNFKYKLEPLVVDDAEAVQRYGYREFSTAAFACTSQGQARRFALMLLWAAKNNTEMCRHVAGTEAAILRPGQVYEVADNRRTQADYGGRVRSIMADVEGKGRVELDRQLSDSALDEAVGNYHISFVKSAGLPDLDTITSSADLAELVKTQITEPQAIFTFNQNSETGRTEVTLIGALPDGVVAGCIFTIKKVAIVPRQFRCLGVVEETPGKYTVEGLEYNPSLFDAVDNNGLFEELPFAIDLDAWKVPKVCRDLRVYAAVVKREDRREWVLTFSWTPPALGFVKEYIVEWRRGLGNFVVAGVTASTSMDFPINVADTYYFRVRAVSIAGRRGPVAVTSQTLRELNVVNAELISGLEVNGQGNENEITTAEIALDWRINDSYADSTLHTDSPPTRPVQIRDYSVVVYNTSYVQLAESRPTETAFVLSYAANAALVGGPHRELIFEVKANTYDNNQSLPSRIRVSNPLPTAPSGITAAQDGSFQKIAVDIIDVGREADFAGYYVWASQTSGFDPSDANLLFQGDTTSFSFPVSSTGTWYVVIGKADTFSAGRPDEMVLSSEQTVVVS